MKPGNLNYITLSLFLRHANVQCIASILFNQKSVLGINPLPTPLPWKLHSPSKKQIPSHIIPSYTPIFQTIRRNKPTASPPPPPFQTRQKRTSDIDNKSLNSILLPHKSHSFPPPITISKCKNQVTFQAHPLSPNPNNLTQAKKNHPPP